MSDLEELAGMEPPDAAALGVRRFQVIEGGPPEKEPTPSYPKVIPASSFAGQLVPARQWHIEGFIPSHNVTQVTADGATGKSLLLQQLAACTVLGHQWLGLNVKRCPVLYLNAEDDQDELHRRMASITRHMEVDMDRLSDLHLWSLAGHSSLLGVSDRRGNIIPTPLLEHLDNLIGELKTGLVLLDPLANLFGGNEIMRTEAMQFIGLLRGLAIKHSAAVVLASHPSLTGMASGTGSSGSTAWNNACRSRIKVERRKDPDDPTDEDARTLTVNKANYGRVGRKLHFRWSDGVFVVDDDAASIAARAEREKQDDKVFLSMLATLNDQGVHVSHVRGTTYAPAYMTEQPAGMGISNDRFKNAMQRLLAAKRIKTVESGPPSRRRSHLEVV